MKTKAYPFTIPGSGFSVLLVELTPSQLVQAFKLAGTDKSQIVQGSRVIREALCQSIREVNGKPVSYSDLSGAGWRKHVRRTRWARQLEQAWQQIHMPDEEEVEDMKATASVSVDDEDREIWTFDIFGRQVALAEQDDELLQDALRAAESKSKSQLVVAFQATIENVCRSLREIDGKPITLARKDWDQTFSVKETYLLNQAFSLIHGGGDEGFELGEAKPGGTESPT